MDSKRNLHIQKGSYHKDHDIYLWSKKVIPFPSLRWKIQAFQDDKRQKTAMPWNNGSAFQFSAHPKMPRKPRKRTTGKMRTRWFGRTRFNPIKMRRPNTPDTKVSELDKINIMAPILTKVCDRLGLSCSYCKQDTLHPSSQETEGPARIGMVPKLNQKKRQTH